MQKADVGVFLLRKRNRFSWLYILKLSLIKQFLGNNIIAVRDIHLSSRQNYAGYLLTINNEKPPGIII
jgi:hypothetical protein